MRSARRSGTRLNARAPAPVVLHSAPLVLPITAGPLRDGAVAVRGERVLGVGPRTELLDAFPVTDERRWPGMIVAGLVDACAAPGPPGPGVTARAVVTAAPVALPGVSYAEVRCASEREWEERGRDALITAIREVDRPCAVGVAPRTRDPHVLEDVAVLARTFGLRLLVRLDQHPPAALDEAGVLGPHCHVACARPLDPGERKLLRLRGTAVALCPSPPHPEEWLALLDEGNPLAFGTFPGGDVLGQAATVRERVRGLGGRVRGLDERLVRAATLGGAQALGMTGGPGGAGSLHAGGRADFAVFDARGRYPYAALLAGPGCLATVVGGHVRPPTSRPPT
ncbi:amidohydrolase family protein [Nonomuraea sp. SBT364]|uniref:amidohydrolase family protein n=1 Tax=Nonomuraea sp. SBT364 TaxID=1580530 RepID=UPI00066A8382|nr:hypothetical protein [Nonomuraea sp. SBT364]